MTTCSYVQRTESGGAVSPARRRVGRPTRKALLKPRRFDAARAWITAYWLPQVAHARLFPQIAEEPARARAICKLPKAWRVPPRPLRIVLPIADRRTARTCLRRRTHGRYRRPPATAWSRSPPSADQTAGESSLPTRAIKTSEIA